MSVKKRAIAGVKWTSISAAVNTFLNFVQTVVLARLLDPLDFGLMAIVLILLGFAQIFSDMGISNAIIYRQDSTKEQLSSLYWLNVSAGVVVFLFCVALSPVIARIYNEPRLYSLILWASLVFLVTPFGQQYEILLQKHLEFNRLAGAGASGYLVSAVVSISFAYSGAGVYSLVWGQLAHSFTRALYLYVISRKEWNPEFHFARRDLKGYLNFGLYQMGDKVTNYINAYLTQFILSFFLGIKTLGYYTLACDIVFKPILVINPIMTRVAFPVFSKTQNDMHTMKRWYMKMIRLLSCCNFPISLGSAAVASVAVPIIYGQQWLPAVSLVQILSFVALLQSTSRPVGPLLLANGKANWGFMYGLGTAFVTIPLLLCGVRWNGIQGACLALLFLYGLVCILTYPLLVRNIFGPCLREYIESMWPALWTSVAMALSVAALGEVFHRSPLWPLLAIQIIFGFAVYLALFCLGQRSIIDEVKELFWSKA